MAKKDKAKTDDVTSVQDLGITDPDGKGKADAADDPVAKLAAQVAALTTGFEKTSEALQKMQGLTMSMLTAGGSQTQKAPDPKAPPGGGGEGPKMPDPVMDPEGYAAALSAQIGKSIDDRFTAQGAATKQQQQQGARTDALWSEFSEAQPEMAKHEDKVEFAASKVVQRAQTRGVDMDRYMFVTSKQFFEDVAGEYEKQFGPVKDDEEGAGDKEVLLEDRPDPSATRTGGVFGGAASGGKPAAGDKDDKPGDLVSEIQEVQRTTGFM